MSDHPQLLDQALAIHEASVDMRDAGRYAAAEALGRQALEMLVRYLDPGDEALCRALHNLAMIREAVGSPTEGEAFFRQSVAASERLGPEGEMARLRIQLLRCLAANLHRQARSEEAKPLLGRALLLAEGSLGANDVEVALVLRQLARLQEDTEHFQQAEATLERAATIAETMPSFDPAERRSLRDEISRVRRRKHRSNRPEATDGAADVPTVTGVPAGSPVGESSDVASHLHNLAAHLAAAGRVDEAVALYRHALAIKKTLGSGDPELVRTLHNLALLRHAAGRADEARALWDEARTILNLDAEDSTPAIPGSVHPPSVVGSS